MKIQDEILSLLVGRKYPIKPPILSLFAVLLILSCSIYENAAERLDFLRFETFNCNVLGVEEGNIFLCTPPDGEVEKIRLVGVRIPEDKKSEAKEFAESILRRGTLVKIEPDNQITDRNGSLHAYVFVPGGKMLNLLLVENGYAEIAESVINDKYKASFLSAEPR